MTTTSILKKFTFALGLLSIVSCDSDFNELGSDIIEDDIHHDNITYVTHDVVAFDRASGGVQANNLPQNALGVYNNAVFGKTVAHFVTQVELGTENPRFTADIVVDSVYLHVPYNSTITGTDPATGASTYTLNNVYGDRDAKIRLRLYRNNYFLRNTDPVTTETQQYFSNEKSLIEAQVDWSQPLNNYADVSQNEQFSFSNTQVLRKYGEDKIAERLAPGIFMYLDKDYFKGVLFGPAGQGKLLNNNIFKEYFRGLYFKVEQIGATGAMLMPNFSEGKIVVIYHDARLDSEGKPVKNDAGDIIRDRKVLNINLRGNTINFFDKEYSPAFAAAVTPSATDETTGNSRLYIDGGEGSMAIIKLNQAQLEALRPINNNNERVLINEANLTFYVDRTVMGASGSPAATEPLRVYLYDVENKTPLYDYYADGTTNSTNNKLNKTVYGGILQTNAEGKSRYRIRITDHINNIINKDSTNVTLGLVVTDNINLIGNAGLKSPFTVTAADPNSEKPLVNVNTIPVSSVISPVGTVLYGSSSDVPESERLKLEIFYTKPN